MWKIFNDFPRELGFPARNCIVYNMKEFFEKINKYNGKATCFTSLYAFGNIKSNGKPEYESAKIRHLLFDLDGPRSLESTQKLHKYLKEQNLKHCIFFSGGGFHTYISVKYPNFLKNKKGAIFNAAVDIADKNNLKIGINEDSDIDAHCIGNVAQLVRVPNTYNLKRKAFCIPILFQELMANPEKIPILAQQQQFFLDIFQGEKLDLANYDSEPKEKVDLPELSIPNVSINVDIDITKFPKCIQKLLSKKLLRHRERFIIITYCKEIGLPIKDTINILRKYLADRTFRHSVFEERQPFWIYRRSDLSFPRCSKLEEEGYCIEREQCKTGQI